MKRILSYLRKYTKESILAPLFKLLEVVFELIVPLVIARLIDEGIDGNGGTPLILQMTLWLVLLAVVGLVSAVTAQYFAAKAATGAATDIRRDLFAKVQAMNYADLDECGASTLLTRLTGDTNQVQAGINMALRLLLRSPFVVFGAMVMAFTVDLSGGVIFGVAIPILFLVVFAILLATLPLYKRVQSHLDAVLRKTRENLRGTRVVRAFRMEDEEIRGFEKENDALLAAQTFAGRISAILNPGTMLLINAAVIVLIYTGAIRVESGAISAGMVVALYNYMSQILIELVKLANLVILLARAIASAKRVAAVLERNNFVPVKTVVPDDVSRARIAFTNVSFRYPTATGETLRGISFEAAKGETVGVIGGTGSGKSSLISLIPRFYDASEGCVTIDGKNVQDYEKDELCRRIAVVPQRNALFSGTIRDNLLFGNESASDEELWDALTAAQGDDIVKSKDGGLDAIVEENGQNLSGGQKQRLCIARALVKKPDILILDDSSSALDAATDARLRKALRALPYDPTVVVVSQRTSSLSHADRILVLDNGELCGVGTHDELLESSDVYREIYDSQSRRGASV